MKPNSELFHHYAAPVLSSLVIGVFILAGSNMLSHNMQDNMVKPGVQVNQNSTAPTPNDPAPTPTIPDISEMDLSGYPVLGQANAPVTIVEYSDFQCPFCKRLFDEVEPQIKKDYIDTGKAKMIYKNYAFLGETSTIAAEGLWCANDQQKFWEYHEYVFSKIGGAHGEWMTEENIAKIATDLKLNSKNFADCISSGKYADKVAQELEEGKKFGVEGTPATFINGQMVPGAQPYSEFKKALDAELAKANQ